MSVSIPVCQIPMPDVFVSHKDEHPTPSLRDVINGCPIRATNFFRLLLKQKIEVEASKIDKQQRANQCSRLM